MLIPSSGKARRLPAIIGGGQFTVRSLIILFDEDRGGKLRRAVYNEDACGRHRATIFVETKSDIAIFRRSDDALVSFYLRERDVSIALHCSSERRCLRRDASLQACPTHASGSQSADGVSLEKSISSSYISINNVLQ